MRPCIPLRRATARRTFPSGSSSMPRSAPPRRARTTSGADRAARRSGGCSAAPCSCRSPARRSCRRRRTSPALPAFGCRSGATPAPRQTAARCPSSRPRAPGTWAKTSWRSATPAAWASPRPTGSNRSTAPGARGRFASPAGSCRHRPDWPATARAARLGRPSARSAGSCCGSATTAPLNSTL